MKNTEIFNSFDMVVSVKQKTINDHFVHLLRMGIIRSNLIIVQEFDEERNMKYRIYDSEDDIPKDEHGNPKYAYISGHMIPKIQIEKSGTEVVFVIEFTSGTAYFWAGAGPWATLKKYDMKDWSYALAVDLNLKGLEKDAIGKKIKVPEIVDKQLNHFMDNMFSVNYLFMDFESTSLVAFDKTYTQTPNADDFALKAFVEFIAFHLRDCTKNNNPYILGYSIEKTEQSKVDANQNVPDCLKPTGTTFTIFKDPVYDDFSNVNFTLVTKGGHATITSIPGVFDSNWIQHNEQCDAKMIYANNVLIEKFILKPLFDNLKLSVYEKIIGHISVNSGNSYYAAKSNTVNGFSYNISDDDSGKDQYVNNYSVSIKNINGKVVLNFIGHLSFYKGISMDMTFCTAKAHASVKIDWEANVNIYTSKDDQGNPKLSLSIDDIKITNKEQHSDKNTCAKTFEWYGKIFGKILDLFNLVSDDNFFSNIFAELFNVKIPSVGTIDIALGNVGNDIKNIIILPAGQVFFFKNPAVNNSGDLSMELTYKSENE